MVSIRGESDKEVSTVISQAKKNGKWREHFK
jgi:hypothetical protein